jgi:hypothetical protein
MVDFGAAGVAYEPKWPGVKELNFADQWRARWNDEHELPENAPVYQAYAMVMMGDKGYATRESGASKWGMVEGLVGDTPIDAWLKAALQEQTGATAGKTELVGYFECKATKLNADFESGEVTVRPFYVVAAKKIDDSPANPRFERRRFPLNEYMVAMRARYPELLDYLSKADERYAIMRARGEA